MAMLGKTRDPDLLFLESSFGRAGLPQPPDLTSDRIKDLLSRGLLEPASLSLTDIRELCASVVHTLTAVRH